MDSSYFSNGVTEFYSLPPTPEYGSLLSTPSTEYNTLSNLSDSGVSTFT